MTALERILGLKQFTGWHMLGVMVLFFGTIISVNLTLAFYAGSTWTGLVVKNTYVESQRFNEVTAELRRQQALGWSAATDYDGSVFTVALTDRDGKAIEDAIVTARLGHPAHENADRMVTLVADGDAGYAAAADLAHGIWAARLSVTGPRGEVWTREIRFTVKEQE
ncbi:FixH family protein [Oricola sp.]|uniref:FixH family protein n=1 Tax=Oricola sp. TaxID=1979950 RepID=UPI003BAB6A71